MKIKKCVLVLIVAVAIMAGFTLGAGSASVRQNVTATLCPDLNIEVDGTKQSLKDAAGNPVYPIVYNGSTYVPFRAIGGLLGVEVDWDQTTQTARYITAGNAQPGSEKPAGPETKKVDLIDGCTYNIKYSNFHSVVKTKDNQKNTIGGESVDHWIRLSRSGWFNPNNGVSPHWITFDIDETFETLSFRAYASYDTTITVYNNGTKDSVLGTVTIKGEADPVDCTINIKQAHQIRIESSFDEGAYGARAATVEDYIYLYNTCLQ